MEFAGLAMLFIAKVLLISVLAPLPAGRMLPPGQTLGCCGRRLLFQRPNASWQKSPHPQVRQSIQRGQPNVVREKYDSGKNTTTLDIPSMPVAGGPFDGLRMFVSFSYTGRIMQKPPEAITLILASTSVAGKYSDEDHRHLTIWLDSEPLDLGVMQLFNSYHGLGSVTEGMRVLVPVKTFTRIATAQQVKMKVGGAEFQLRESQLQSLRQLSRRLV